MQTRKYKNYLTIKEAAEMIGVSPLTLRNWDRDGKLKASRNPINNYRLYKLEDIRAFLRKIDLSRKLTPNRASKKVFLG